jgi:hypothetical protein
VQGHALARSQRWQHARAADRKRHPAAGGQPGNDQVDQIGGGALTA